MLTSPECLPCILGDVYAAARLATDSDTALRVARESCGYVASKFSLDVPPSYHITAVHRILKRVAGIEVPFAANRASLNLAATEVAKEVRRDLDALSDGWARFRHAAAWSLAGNSLDTRTTGVGYGFDARHMHQHLLAYVQRNPAQDQLAHLYATAQPGRNVLFVHDNVGEIALDALLIEQMRYLGCRVTSVVRGGPITSDATMEDAMAVGLHRSADDVILAGPDTLGVSFTEMSDELRLALDAADLVIAKGQANFYVFSEYARRLRSPVFMAFSVKCSVVALACGVPQRSTVAAFLPLQ